MGDMDMRTLLSRETPEKIEDEIRRYELRRVERQSQSLLQQTAVLDGFKTDMKEMLETVLQSVQSLQGEVQAQRKDIAALRTENEALRAAMTTTSYPSYP